jgi:hypothetical protein
MAMKVFKPREKRPPGTDCPPEWTEQATLILAGRFRADLSCGSGGFRCEWSPDTPRKGQLTKSDLKAYQACRGGSVVLFE